MDTRTKIENWGRFIRAVRAFFDERGYQEVFTDALVPVGAFESSLDCLKVGTSSELHTSPEFEMKRLLAEVRIPIYQIARCFRDDPPTGIHRREFTMLEFYRPDCDYRTTLEETRALFEALSDRPVPFEELTVSDSMERVTKAPWNEMKDLDRFRQILRPLMAISEDDTWDDLFFKLLVEKIEPSLDPTRPTILKDYPPSQCALGRIDPVNGVTERFEIYWQGMELCNGCTELTDIHELRTRFDRECHLRTLHGKAPHAFPERLFTAFERGLPPSSGVAIGLDRLFAALSGSKTVW